MHGWITSIQPPGLMRMLTRPTQLPMLMDLNLIRMQERPQWNVFDAMRRPHTTTLHLLLTTVRKAHWKGSPIRLFCPCTPFLKGAIVCCSALAHDELVYESIGLPSTTIAALKSCVEDVQVLQFM